jgi:hypothetical protein
MIDPHNLGVDVVRKHHVVVANNLTTRTVEGFQTFDLVAAVDHVDDAGGLDLVTLLVDEGPGVIELPGGTGNALQPA